MLGCTWNMSKMLRVPELSGNLKYSQSLECSVIHKPSIPSWKLSGNSTGEAKVSGVFEERRATRLVGGAAETFRRNVSPGPWFPRDTPEMGMMGNSRRMGSSFRFWKCLTGWWFGTFYIFPYIGNNHPNWLIFFRGVQTTNQLKWWILIPDTDSQPSVFRPNFILSPPNDGFCCSKL